MAESIQFYMDQHIPSTVAQGLRRHGVDVLTAQEGGRCSLTDPEQLEFATADERVLVTFDSDFLELHQANVEHAGIAWCPAQKYSIGELIQALLLVHGVLNRGEMDGHVEYL